MLKKVTNLNYLIMIVIVSIFLVTGCTQSKKDNKKETTSETEETSSEIHMIESASVSSSVEELSEKPTEESTEESTEELTEMEESLETVSDDLISESTTSALADQSESSILNDTKTYYEGDIVDLTGVVNIYVSDFPLYAPEWVCFTYDTPVNFNVRESSETKITYEDCTRIQIFEPAENWKTYEGRTISIKGILYSNGGSASYKLPYVLYDTVVVSE